MSIESRKRSIVEFISIILMNALFSDEKKNNAFIKFSALASSEKQGSLRTLLTTAKKSGVCSILITYVLLKELVDSILAWKRVLIMLKQLCILIIKVACASGLNVKV